MLFDAIRKTVLVVDDDPSAQRLIKVRLESREKLDVIQATSGVRGMEKASQQSPDVIVLDWLLPDIQGLEVLKLLRENKDTSNIPVLMLTGRDKVGDIEDAFDIGANAYMTKPFELTKLGEKVAELLQ